MENEIITDGIEEITEVFEEVTNVDRSKALKIIIGSAATAIIGTIVYKKAVKPTIGKFKDWKEKRKIEKKYADVIDETEDYESEQI